MNSKRTRRLCNAAIVNLVLILLLVAGIAYAATTQIDSFNDGTTSLWVDSANPTAASAVDSTVALGGERDVYLEWLSGTAGRVYVDVDYGGTSDRLAYTAGDGMYGQATISWDGNDDNGAVLDNDGLAGVDLTDGGTNNGIVAEIINDDLPSILTLRIYANTATPNWSYYTVNVPALNPGTRMDVFFPFSGFTLGGGTGATFTNVGAVVAVIRDNGYASLDVSLDFLEASSAREYGDLPLATYSSSILSASHIPQGLRLGLNCDAEATYNQSTGADGDDSSSADDEDGLLPLATPWLPGFNGRVRVTLSGCADSIDGCYVNGWIDWNRDGTFGGTVDGASETIIPNTQYYNGNTALNFTTPTSLDTGYYYARFRVCTTSTACDSPDNTDTNVLNGEVEDYRWQPGPTAVRLLSFTATPDLGGIRLDWETATEVDNLGFNLYRAGSIDDTPQQLNAVLIPSQAPGSPVGATYTWLDDTAAPGSIYYYWLDDVDTHGNTTRHGPVWATSQPAGANRVFLPLIRK